MSDVYVCTCGHMRMAIYSTTYSFYPTHTTHPRHTHTQYEPSLPPQKSTYPSSVSVPVLSNATVSIHPAVGTLCGSATCIPCVPRRLMEMPRAIAKQAGSAGGTTTVIMSSALAMIKLCVCIVCVYSVCVCVCVWSTMCMVNNVYCQQCVLSTMCWLHRAA